jgi:hypothetical protein
MISNSKQESLLLRHFNLQREYFGAIASGSAHVFKLLKFDMACWMAESNQQKR